MKRSTFLLGACLALFGAFTAKAQCDEPIVLVACLDVNDNGICDAGDEAISPTESSLTEYRSVDEAPCFDGKGADIQVLVPLNFSGFEYVLPSTDFSYRISFLINGTSHPLIYGLKIDCAESCLFTAQAPNSVQCLQLPDGTEVCTFDYNTQSRCLSYKTGCSNLPVELTSFKGNGLSCYTQLEWATASEQMNVGFQVQRTSTSLSMTNTSTSLSMTNTSTSLSMTSSSTSVGMTNASTTDGAETGTASAPQASNVEWENIAWVEGHGTTAEAQRYGYEDKDAEPGRAYLYRLLQLDEDGGINECPSIYVEVANCGNKAFHLFPTVTARQLHLSWTGFEAERYEVIDVQGQVWKTGGLDKAQLGRVLDIGNLPSGTYFLIAHGQEISFVEKFLKI